MWVVADADIGAKGEPHSVTQPASSLSAPAWLGTKKRLKRISPRLEGQW